MPHRLSKSRYTSGLQCHRQLWWKVHEPRAPELTPDAKLQARFDMGHRVGIRARQEFPGATLIELDHRHADEALAATRQALVGGDTAILEAAFKGDNIFVAVDALTKEGDAWVITEVKASTGVKPQYLADAAVQAHVVENAGLPVARIELMHLNNQHRHPDEGPLFTRADITAEANALRPNVPVEAHAQLTMLAGPLPDVQPGAHCKYPYDCPFLARCIPPAPENTIGDLYRLGPAKRRNLLDQGIETIDRIPSDFPLSDLQQRQRRAVRADTIVVEPGLKKELSAYRFPIAMLDFETINPALPVWDGCAPFQKVPVQFSVHTIEADGTISHHAFLAEGQGDPRPAAAAALAPALQTAQTILAWHASFEKECLQTLAAASPLHAAVLNEAITKLHDLLPVVRNHVYHRGFNGSFSIKRVVPALLPSMSYDDLDLADGEIAASYLEMLLCRPHELAEDTTDHLRAQLSAYCEHDTAVMVELFGYLRTLSA